MAGFIEDTFDTLQTGSEAYIADTYSAFSGPLLTTMKGLFIIMVTWYGYQIAMGRSSVHLSEIVKRLGWMVVIIAAITAYTTYKTFLFDIVMKLPEGVGSILFSAFARPANGEASGTAASSGLQRVWDAGFAGVSAAYAKAGITSLGAFLVALMLAIGTLFFVCVGVFIIGVGKVMAIILLAIGPIFIGLSVFQWTRQWTFSWINMLFNTMCILMVGYAVVGFFLGIANTAVQSAAASADDLSIALPEVAQFTFFCILGGIVFTQVPQIATGLAGGFTMSGSGAGQQSWAKMRYGARRARIGVGNLANWNVKRTARLRDEARKELRLLSGPSNALTDAQTSIQNRLSR
jgi:type IV secretion system protein VirB6